MANNKTTKTKAQTPSVSKHLTLDQLSYIKAVKAAMNGKKGFARHIASKLNISLGAAQKAISNIDSRIENYGKNGKGSMSEADFADLTKNIKTNKTMSVKTDEVNPTA